MGAKSSHFFMIDAKALKEANIEFISKINAGFLDSLPNEEDNPWEQIYAPHPEESSVLQLINIRSKKDGVTLYPESLGGPLYTTQRFQAWCTSPSRMLVNSYEHMATMATNDLFEESTGCSAIHELTLENIHDINQDLEPLWTTLQMSKYIQDHNIALAPGGLTSDGCVLVVSGLGLGFQLQPLIDFLNPSALLIVEPDLGKLAHTLETVDYTQIIPRFTGADKALDFIVSATPEAAAEQIRSLLTIRNLFLVDGLFTFVGFDDPFFKYVKDLVHSYETMKGVNYLGYFVDEVHMTMNAALNYFHLRPKVYTTLKIKTHKQHAVIVASGPSLAEHLEMLKQHRDRYTIFCCYSTISRLLEAGITPDYHCDLERHNDHLPLLELGLEDVLAEISLCSSSTCDPRMLKLYKNVYSINRGALTPSVIFTKDNDIIPNEGPDVATFALLSAIFFGYHTVHLFGVDLGTANRAVARLPGVLDIDRRTYDVPVRGNLGRTVFSGQALLDNKTAIEGNISFYSQIYPSLLVYNYSNGVYINGAIPSKPDEFLARLPEHQVPPPIPEFEPYSDEHVRQAWALADMRRRCFSFLNNIRDLAQDPFESSTLYKVSDLCNAAGKSYQDQIPIRFYRGSLFRSWITLWGIYTRAIVQNAEDRENLKEECKRVLGEVINSFESLTFQLIDYVEGVRSIDEFTFASKLQRDSQVVTAPV